jgi:RimJ/RimL family protein N-acetyltransferase
MYTKCTITFSGHRYEIDDDPGRVDPATAVAFLTTQAYWARWRPAAVIAEQIRTAWRVIGAYDETGAMVGFARASSDGLSRAYLADVYVLPAHRGAGLGKAIVRAMIEDGPGAGLAWMLHTADAHGLYRQFGFAAPDSMYLERPGQASAAPVSPDPLDTGTLVGQHVRLEPLGYHHMDGIAAAAAGGGDLYRWVNYLVPSDPGTARRFVEIALGFRDRRAAVPYAVVRNADDTVIGSTRFHQLDYWPWADAGAPKDDARIPDTAEIGWTWLNRNSLRTGANTEMKRLMLSLAFETWGVATVCLHADARNERSRAAIERIGARFEGILRGHRLAADLTPRDSARYSVTMAEWPEVKQRLEKLSDRGLGSAYGDRTWPRRWPAVAARDRDVQRPGPARPGARRRERADQQRHVRAGGPHLLAFARRRPSAVRPARPRHGRLPRWRPSRGDRRRHRLRPSRGGPLARRRPGLLHAAHRGLARYHPLAGRGE